jgi:hypothetical protein
MIGFRQTEGAIVTQPLLFFSDMFVPPLMRGFWLRRCDLRDTTRQDSYLTRGRLIKRIVLASPTLAHVASGFGWPRTHRSPVSGTYVWS